MIDTNIILDDILNRAPNAETARKISQLATDELIIAYLTAVDGQDCQKAVDLPMGDFEDALVVVCAEKAALDYIITNDSVFLSGAALSVPTISPTNYLLKLA